MIKHNTQVKGIKNFSFYDESPKNIDNTSEILQGLLKTPKTLSPKFFYDEKGSKLFDQICELPEYYPTRTEISLLDRYTDAFSELIGNDCALIELGSGSSVKIRMLLEAIKPTYYIPLDISLEHLKGAASHIAADYPWLTVQAICIDYSGHWQLDHLLPKNYRKAAFFPGSSIGNFEPSQAHKLLKNVARMVGPGGGLLIGVDTKKEANILESAYNDRQGITAQFNLNMLHHINNHFNTNFNVNHFKHHAFYNAPKSRIEMHLIATKNHRVSLQNRTIQFIEGENIHTENSYKYSSNEFATLCKGVGFNLIDVWTDDKGLFNVYYLEVDKARHT